MRALAPMLALAALLACGDATEAPTPAPAAPPAPLPITAPDAVAGKSMMAPGAAVMPDDLAALDPSQYSEELARFIPVERGMDRYAAKDEFLVYYNAEPGPQTRVSMTEKMLDGATIFVIRRTGMQDDSVSAEESYAVFDAGVLAAYGSRVKCRRGASPDVWVTEVCP